MFATQFSELVELKMHISGPSSRSMIKTPMAWKCKYQSQPVPMPFLIAGMIREN